MRYRTYLRGSCLVLTCLALTSCNALPSSGPSVGKILEVSKEAYAPYTLIEVTAPLINMMSGRGQVQLFSAFGNARKKSSSRIGIGDTIVVSIWEASSEGLFASAVGGRGGGAMVPEQPVSENGTITVPYAGTITVVGKTPGEVKAQVEKALQGMAVEPQVLISVIKNLSNTVTVTGEVANSGRIPLSARGEKLLDIIAIAGGPRKDAHELAVQISRGNRTETIPMERLVSDPRENIYVQPDDVIALIRQPRSFTVFGASTSNESVQFDESRLYLNQALAKVGGLNDERANAKGVFIYRSEPVDLVRRLFPGKPIQSNDGLANVIYQIDLKDPNGFFLLKSFEIYNSDLIYIANSSLAEVRKFATLVSSTAAPVAQAASINNTLSR
ncbi:polysaccharide biosynthesis/export family protein [Ensifer soli]|uniref:polysaccharide biosynthesis/export family protein n=1 Tax=Ciceribacter sp. sgz301302 TaxID=3342379 RepID=UPI0035BA5FC4